ncbi:MAG: homoserine dehydrogenase [Candidatus Schekmanbacteria bacterium RIFCSPHIGHO2_02_FULL_38_11]|uniref:Homoserine dehydrogenase n=1 Tax=Candidatus Schekmanbacteria bacterium RIFCSPLOWO2_12_FULL_38_15 TaxID=1817883 RepID=A0A1F7SES8_9BACT|nr:MAG: homoserine dehydrogenase [Candidatus Schekmanbacteria bacterium GWA2_38_9]OGL49913.1 MAG: homoserine dehydrogenase [Candidatus Schekmanbacteria bacterium RIFCSPLOWO2_02_FULL_38_14]OGL51666.1 MAG: homoserine dehydrogenase [Candidatus Schekmanbacteria bacterium RIFCSPHIGHO2_02_FULL_38_11]OGL52241.1 MAG: homoserine dehydrogenase [Candidatus Schekmanbacteria bacterium RIFCSPLOWO2_12_FULL_38_15]
MRQVNVGIIGFGTVGKGTVKVLLNNKEIISERLGAEIKIKKIADLDITASRGIEIKKELLTKDALQVINDPEIDIVAELIGGYSPAKEFILKALKNKKRVVTANKALLALEGYEIFKCAQENNMSVGFEASVAGGIPIIKAIKEGLVANHIQSIYGIINGTSNYILTKMTDEGKEFGEVLKKAQEMGFAEADPTFDIEGIDTSHKIAILATLAYGTRVNLKEVYTEGITKVSPLDIKYAMELGYKIKLLAIAKDVNGEIDVRVHPTMVSLSNPLSTVGGVFNAIRVTGDAVGETIFYGRGAGELPTASAVVADIVEISRDILTGSKNRVPLLSFQPDCIKDKKIRKISKGRSRFYFRFSVIDQPGVLSKISGILGDNNISIASVIQKERKEGEEVSVVIMAHEALEKDVEKALNLTNKLPVVLKDTVLIRVEE